MSKIETLRQQAAQAERLAREAMDRLTTERLQAFAAECYAKVAMLSSQAAS
jgi:hypothetical protein